tara:strand:- start:191 stop:1702 length:1512 start_codon:yes stop_codon:yes gene_type:complete
MKNFLYLSLLALFSIALIYSCSAEEEDTTPPSSIIQTPGPETPAPTQYALEVTAGEGGTVSTEGGTYDEGTEVTITATANEGYRFTGWEGNDSTSESLTITLNSNQTYQALFELIPIYTLTVTTSERGTVSTEGGEYAEGTEIKITATPNEGYRFDGWEGIDSNESTITLSLTSDTEISPIFIVITQVPSSYEVDEYWGQIVEFEPELFFSEDIPESVQSSIINSLKLATDYFGKYGPQEWWVMGEDENSKNKLIIKFCERRVEKSQANFWGGNENLNSCIDNMTGRWEDAGSFYSSRSKYFGYLQIVLTLNNQEITDATAHFRIDTVVHEYTHAVQHSLNNNPLVPELRNKPDGWGSPFFTEGAAVYYAEYIPRKLSNLGVNIDWWPITNSFDLRDRMKNYMVEDIIPNLVNCPDLNTDEINYETLDTCDPYRFGAWGVAFLLDKAENQDAFWQTFWPRIDEIGYNEAFLETFGISLETFEQEFLEFLELPIEQQLEIIPDI